MSGAAARTGYLSRLREIERRKIRGSGLFLNKIIKNLSK